MAKRIFIGIPAQQELKNKAKEFSLSHSDLPVRWVKPHNLHITLVPPWNSAGVQAENNKLKAIRDFAPFTIAFNKIELGPNRNRPNLIWAKGEAPREIVDLRLRIFEALNRRVDERPFRLHLTLARLNGEVPSLLIREGKAGWTVNWRMEVYRFVLYESHLLPQGAEYEVLEEFGFGI